MPKIYFTKEEKLTIENNILKENNLNLQVNLLQNERQGFIQAFCDKNNKDTAEVVNINIQEGYIEFIEPVAE